MTFDMNRAWEEAVRMLKANKELVLVLAGLFFFLPTFALGIFVPETLTGPDLANAADPVQETAAYYNRNSLWLLLVQIIQFLGMLSILALFARRRPTVGQAIKSGGIVLLPLIVAQLFLTLAIGVIGGTIVGIVAAVSVPLAYAVAILVLLVILFVTARLAPLMPLMVAEHRLNPFRALVDSWRMTAGRGWRILGFLLLIGIAIMVVSMLLSGATSLVAALIANANAANLIASALTAIFGAFWLTLLMAVLMAIYRQLTATSSAAGVPRTHSENG